MAFARDVSTAAASQTDFTISFPYLNQDGVKVFVDGVLQTLPADYTFFNATTVRFNSGLAGGETVVRQRSTSQTERLVNFTATTLTEADLDTDGLQGFYMAQEAIDIANNSMVLNSSDNWEGQSKQIQNVADPTVDQDAATKKYGDDNWGGAAATNAAASAAAAASSASAAQTAETNAETAETNAEAAQTAAEAALDSFDDRYLGPKASDPALDNDGNALLTGALYWSTTLDKMRVYDGSAWQTMGRVGNLPTGYIDGFEMSLAADTDHDMTMDTGTCRSADDTADVTLEQALTKQIDVTWAEGGSGGTPVGGLFSGASLSANGSLHAAVIEKDSDGTVDWGWDTDPVGANVPSGWTFRRRVASRRLDSSSNLIPTTQRGDYVSFDEHVSQSLSGVATGTTTPSTHALNRIPTGIAVRVKGSLVSQGGPPNNTGIYDINVTLVDLNIGSQAGGNSSSQNAEFEARTDTSGQIKAAVRTGSVTTPPLVLHGFYDRRGKR